MSFKGKTVVLNGSFRVKKLISSAGRFGEVYIATDNNRRTYALKVIPLDNDLSLRKLAEKEMHIWKTISGSKYVVNLVDFRVDGQYAFGLMDFCTKSLVDVLNEREVSETEALRIFLDVSLGVDQLHSQNPPIIHRDIKIENVLLSEDGGWKLCDFGSATTKVMKPSSVKSTDFIEDLKRNTTLCYQSPEIVALLNGEQSDIPINEKSDIWALGCLFFKTAFCVDAFDGALGIMNQRFFFPSTPYRSTRIKDFISSIFVSANSRPNINKVIKSICALGSFPTPLIKTPPEREKEKDETAAKVEEVAKKPILKVRELYHSKRSVSCDNTNLKPEQFGRNATTRKSQNSRGVRNNHKTPMCSSVSISSNEVDLLSDNDFFKEKPNMNNNIKPDNVFFVSRPENSSLSHKELSSFATNSIADPYFGFFANKDSKTSPFQTNDPFTSSDQNFFESTPQINSIKSPPIAFGANEPFSAPLVIPKNNFFESTSFGSNAAVRGEPIERDFFSSPPISSPQINEAFDSLSALAFFDEKQQEKDSLPLNNEFFSSNTTPISQSQTSQLGRQQPVLWQTQTHSHSNK